MGRQRLAPAEFAGFVAGLPGEIADLVVALREFLLRAAPGADEAVRFHALCYFKPGRPYGAIGGNICMIAPKPDCVRLEFIHGAALPDPDGLLVGAAKAKRYVEIRQLSDIKEAPFRSLIHAAIAHEPLND